MSAAARLTRAMPTRPLERIRVLLLLLSVFAAAVNVSRIWLTSSAPWPARIVATISVALLAGWWSGGFRRGSFPEAGLGLEGLALVGMGYGNGSPPSSLGLLLVGLAFRSLYGGGARGLLPVLTYGAAFSVGLLLDPVYASRLNPTNLAQIFGILAFGVSMWLFSEALIRQEQADETRLQALSDLNRFKDELLDGVAHELRTPLTSILAYSEMLLTYDDPVVRKEFLTIINVESQRLCRLVNNVLDMTKIQSGTTVWNMSLVDTTELLRDAARIHRPIVEREGLHFELAVEPNLPTVEADRDRLLEVIANLVNNALKFTMEGAIGLRAACVGPEVQVAIEDTGIGVPEAERERIFDKFQQLTSTLQGKPRGTGLGLAICRDVIAHHNGRIWVDERRGGGSVFTFSLPCAQP
jgi:signal transduction histidine kinase